MRRSPISTTTTSAVTASGTSIPTVSPNSTLMQSSDSSATAVTREALDALQKRGQLLAATKEDSDALEEVCLTKQVL